MADVFISEESGNDSVSDMLANETPVATSSKPSTSATPVEDVELSSDDGGIHQYGRGFKVVDTQKKKKAEAKKKEDKKKKEQVANDLMEDEDIERGKKKSNKAIFASVKKSTTAAAARKSAAAAYKSYNCLYFPDFGRKLRLKILDCLNMKKCCEYSTALTVALK